MMFVGMIETRFLKMLLKSLYESYSDLFIKQYHGILCINMKISEVHRFHAFEIEMKKI